MPKYSAGFLRKVRKEGGNLSPVLASMVSVVKLRAHLSEVDLRSFTCTCTTMIRGFAKCEFIHNNFVFDFVCFFVVSSVLLLQVFFRCTYLQSLTRLTSL